MSLYPIVPVPPPRRLPNNPDAPAGLIRACGVFEAGGMKGMALSGALDVLEEHIYWERLFGVSAGAIAAGFIAAGYDGAQLFHLLAQTNFNEFKDVRQPWGRLGLPGRLLSMQKHRGVWRGEKLHQWLETVLANAPNVRRDADGNVLRDANGTPQTGVVTFADLKLHHRTDLPPNKRYRLVVLTSDLNARRGLRIPWDLEERLGINPDTFPVALALRASGSLPLAFEPVRVRSSRTGEVHHLVDGGISTRFPIEQVLNERADGYASPLPPEPLVIGLRLASPERLHTPHRITGFRSYLNELRTTLEESREARLEPLQDWFHVLNIDTALVDVRDFDAPRFLQESLYINGVRAARSWLKVNRQLLLRA